MSTLKISLGGFDNVIKAFTEKQEQTKKVLNDELNLFGQGTTDVAKRLCPVDEGFLRNSISFVKSDLKVSIIVAAFYAAYVEFGTRKFAAAYVSTLPNDWQVFAAQYKGKGPGTFDEFVMNLVRWITVKGLVGKVKGQSKATTAQADAYGLALYIIRNGTRPHPFLFPAVRDNTKLLIERLKQKL